MPAASSSIYWNSGDSQRSSGCDGSDNNSSLSAGSNQRRYVDPWDLENYAYLRRRQIEIKVPRNDDLQQRINYTNNGNNNSPRINGSSNDSNHWYPMPAIRESGGVTGNDEAAISSSVDDLYLIGSNSDEITMTNGNGNRHRQRQRHQRQDSYYQVQQEASYEDESHRYVTPNPVYVPLSDIEYAETSTEQVFPKISPRRRNRVIRNLTQHLDEECPCPFHGPLPADIAMAKEMGTNKPVKQLGLNTYGHLRIDYAKSWNSLHRKMKK